MIEEVLRIVLDAVGVEGIPIGIVASLLVTAHYGHSALGVAAIVATWTRVVLVGSVVLAVLIGTGVLDLDVDRLLVGFDLAVELAKLVGELLL
jgi:hypothetical protein